MQSLRLFIRSLLGRILFSHVTPYIDRAAGKQVTIDDMPPLHPWFDPNHCPPAFETVSLKSVWSMLFGTLRASGALYRGMVTAAFATTALNLTIPLLIKWFVTLIQTVMTSPTISTQTTLLSILCSGGLILVTTTHATMLQHYYYAMLGHIQRVVNGVNIRIYDHALNIRRDARQRYPVGDVINFMGTDADAVGEFGFAACDLATSVLTIVVVAGLLFSMVGWSALPAIVLLSALAPATHRLGRRFVAVDDQILRHRDQRVSLMSQILSGIRIVKFFGWEGKLFDEIKSVREREIIARRRLAWTAALSLLVYMTASILVSTMTFVFHLYRGFPLDAPTVFSCLALFAVLEGPFGHLSEYLGTIAASKASGERILKFLREPVRPDRPYLQSAVLAASSADSPRGARVILDHFSASHVEGGKVFLHDLSVVFRPGESTAIIGAVGAGKTSILMAILGEMQGTEGQIAVEFPVRSLADAPTASQVAYVPQEAFVRNSSIRHNIMFTGAAPLDSKAGDHDANVRHAVWCAGLDVDLAAMGNSVDLEIGEHGVNLSGGQKQRLGLARAVFQDADLILMDDPVSAVDTSTEKVIMDRLIFGEWADRTRIMVTHRLDHLERFDRVILVQEGQIVADGRHTQLLKSDSEYLDFVRHASLTESPLSHEVSPQSIAPASPAASAANGSRFTQEEDRQSGGVDSAMYGHYVRSFAGRSTWGRKVILPAVFAFVGLVTLAPLLQNIFLAKWMNHQSNELASAGSSSALLTAESWHNVMIYGAIGLGVILLSLGWHLFVQFRAIAGGRTMHDDALRATLHTRVRFFDTTPVGRVLNRFSRDVDSIERELVWSFDQCLRASMHALVSLITMTFVLPVLCLTVIPMAWGYLKLQKKYRTISREAQRLTSITRSPRFAHFKESLAGLESIRAFDARKHFRSEYLRVLQSNQRAFHSLVVSNRWFSVRIPLLGSLVSGVVIGLLMYAGHHRWLLPGTVGMLLLYAVRFWESANWAIRSFSVVEARMTSVERLRHYGALPCEPSVVREPALESQIPWPRSGSVEFRSVSARYAPELPNVLRDVSFKLPAGAKLGIAGRTGAGKSTVLQLLFRFIEVESGQVLIDGVDIATVPLARLRRAIAIIPQDPTLFKGNLRDNLDRFGQYSDQDIWVALGRVHLRTFVEGLPGQLRSEVIENGANFSQGQRQLLCFARALLLNAPIIVLDEATASVDLSTDSLIQATIREAFHDRTLIIIAHRLETTKDCNYLMQLEAGRVVRWQELISETPATQESHDRVNLFSGSLDQSSHFDVLRDRPRDR